MEDTAGADDSRDDDDSSRCRCSVSQSQAIFLSILSMPAASNAFVALRPAPQNKKCKEQKCTCTVCRRGSDVKAHMEFLDKFAAPAVSEPASALKPVFEDRLVITRS